MQAIDSVAWKALKQPVGEHGPRPAQPLLGGLEDHMHRAGEVTVLSQPARRPKHDGVPVMATGVHEPRLCRNPGFAGCFSNGQCIHIGAQSNRAGARPPALGCANHTEAADPFRHADPKG